MDWSHAYLINGVIILKNITLNKFDFSSRGTEERNNYWQTQKSFKCQYVNNPNGIWEQNSNFKALQPIVNKKKLLKAEDSIVCKSLETH